MGNSPAVLLRDYRELTTDAEAKGWFGVNPGVKSDEVIQFKNKLSHKIARHR
jgi:hypothetical protein